MPPRITIVRPLRSLAYRPRAEAMQYLHAHLAGARRSITADEKPLPTQDQDGKPGPNQEQLPHVSEEAAETNRIMGEEGPELQQGTPVSEVLSRTPTARKHAPEALKDELNQKSGKNGGNNTPSGTRSYSTSARRAQQDMTSYGSSDGMPPLPPFLQSSLPTTTMTTTPSPSSELVAGHKFGLPALPLGPHDHKDYRYDPCIRQLTSLLMRDGELSKAQTNMARILNHLRTSPAPRINPDKPLLPGAPPASHLPLNPVLYLQLAVDSVAPLMRLKSQKGIAGGGVSVQIPVPLRLKQRRRQAFMWILETVEKKPSRGSGSGMFAQKVAEEVISIIEGRSGVWEKRQSVHRFGTAARSNLGKKPGKFGK